MSIWPIEEEPLGPGEVLVSHEQFAALALLAEKKESGAITDEQFAEDAIKVEPLLRRGEVNKLVVRSSRPRWY